MYYKKNVNIYHDNGKAVIRTWDKVFNMSGGEKMCRLVRDILTFCLFDRTEDEIAVRFSYVNTEFLSKLIVMMRENNILSDDRYDKEYKVSHDIISYVNRNYKNGNEILEKLESSGITVISSDISVLESVRNFGFCSDSLRYIDGTENEGNSRTGDNEFIIIDLCSGIPSEIITEDMNCGAGVICLYNTGEGDICAAAFNNTQVLRNCLLRIPVSKSGKKPDPNHFDLACRLSSLMIIDNLMTGELRNNVCIVRKDLMIDRCTVDDRNYCSFRPAELFPEVRDTDRQVITNELFMKLNNGCLPIGRIRYTDGEQEPFLTLQCDVFTESGVRTVYGSGENFTEASLRCFRSAVLALLRGSETIRLGCKEDQRIAVSYTGSAEDIISEAAAAILKNEGRFEYYEVTEEVIESVLSDDLLPERSKLPAFRIIAGGNDEYSVYEAALISDKCSIYGSGTDIFDILRQLLMNYSYASENGISIYTDIDISSAALSGHTPVRTVFSADKALGLAKDLGYEITSEKCILEEHSKYAYIRKITVKKYE